MFAPNVPDKFKGMTEADMFTAMSEDEKLDYRLDKREWTKKIEGFKKQMETAKTESENMATQLKAHQEKSRITMKQNTADFPGFEEQEPAIAKILNDLPELAGLPNAQYLGYFISMGDTYLTYLRGVADKTAASKTKAAQEAAATAAAAGGGSPNAAVDTGRSAKTDKHDDLMARTAAAYHKRNKVWAS